MPLYTAHPETRSADGQPVAALWDTTFNERQPEADAGLVAEAEAADDGLVAEADLS